MKVCMIGYIYILCVYRMQLYIKGQTIKILKHFHIQQSVQDKEANKKRNRRKRGYLHP